MGDRVDIESFDGKVIWLRPNHDRVVMTIDEFHEMFDLSKAARLKVKYPNLTTVVRRMTEDQGAFLLVEVFGMTHEDAVNLLLELT